MLARVCAALVLNLCVAASAIAYVGEGYLQLPGVAGAWHGANYQGWVRVDGRYWGRNSYARANGTGPMRARGYYSGPSGPQNTAGDLVVSIDKRSPALAPLMEQCSKQATLPEAVFAESADGFRNAALELGERPAKIPKYFEYRLKDVRITDCPVDARAPEQALVLKFSNIEWLNYHPPEKVAAPGPDAMTGRMMSSTGVELTLSPAGFPPSRATGATRSFIVSWFGFAHDISNDQCPKMNRKPLPEEFGLSAAELEKQQEARGPFNALEKRGAGQLNVCLLPGIAPDPGNASPQTKVARGLNLDGNDGTGAPPRGICKHQNFQSEDGRTGIDNQFYRVAACIPGLQGRKGLWQQVLNDEWRNGALALMIEISGIDNEQNDDSVDVTIFYSQDPPVKDATGQELLADYTFRVADKPEFTHFFKRMHGRIVNGVIVTDQVRELKFNMVKGPILNLANAQLRLEIKPDGNLQGLLGGYQDWRYLANYYNSIGFEVTFGFQCPGFFNALKRNADGMMNPDTGECDGISTAYDIEAVPAYIPPTQYRQMQGGTAQRATQAAANSGDPRLASAK
jgi:type VI protein secretion system component Hcp